MTYEDKNFECRILRDHLVTRVVIAGNEKSLEIYKNKFDTLVKEKNVPGFQISKRAYSDKIWGKTKILRSKSSNEISRDSSGYVTEDDKQKAEAVEKHESENPEKDSQKPNSDKMFIRSRASTPLIRGGRGHPIKTIPVIRKQPEGKFSSYEDIIESMEKKIAKLKASKKGLKTTIAELEAYNKELTKELEAQKQQTDKYQAHNKELTKELDKYQAAIKLFVG